MSTDPFQGLTNSDLDTEEDSVTMDLSNTKTEWGKGEGVVGGWFELINVAGVGQGKGGPANSVTVMSPFSHEKL